MRLPIRLPATIAISASWRESAGTRNAAATRTSSDTPRLPQRSAESANPSTRKRSGTGSTPQAGVSVFT
jgi:hypothetical protein